MIRISTLIALPCLVLASSSVLAQTKATPQARAAYARVVAVRDSLERSHGHFVAVNGIRMHYLEWGDAKGAPLVWAHGSGSDGYELRHVAPRLVQAGYRVLAVDYRGHGQTRVKDANFGIYHIADDLVAILDSLKIPAAVFGGASKGGSVAAAVYDQYPTRALPAGSESRQAPHAFARALPSRRRPGPSRLVNRPRTTRPAHPRRAPYTRRHSTLAR